MSGDYPAPVTTTYTLRSASPAKTRSDAVVVGVCKTDKGPELAAGGEDVAAAFGRRLRPMLASLGVTGASGESVRIPTAGTLNAPLLVLVGLGRGADRRLRTPGGRRRCPERAQRLVGRPRPARGRRRAGLGRPPGLRPGRLHVQPLQVGRQGRPAGRRGRPLPRRPRRRDRRGVQRRPGGRRGGRHDARLGQRAPRQPDPAAVRRRREGRAQGRHQGSGRSLDRTPGLRRGEPRRARVRRHPGRRPRLGRAAEAGPARLRARGRHHPPRPGRQGHHLRLRRPDHQAGQLHGHHEVRHGRCRGRAAGHPRDRDPGAADPVTAWAPMAENMVSGDAIRPGDVLTIRAAGPSRSSTPTPRGGWCWPTPSCWPPRTTPT